VGRSAAVLAALGLAVFTAGGAEAATVPNAPPPAAALGIWTSAEDGGSCSAVAGQHPDIAN
jgi:Glycosyl hydrolase family 26